MDEHKTEEYQPYHYAYFPTDEYREGINRYTDKAQKHGLLDSFSLMRIGGLPVPVPLDVILGNDSVPYDYIVYPGKTIPTQKTGTFNAKDFFPVYKEAYWKGIEFFEKDFRHADSLYTEHGQALATSIWQQYSQTGWKDKRHGWKYVKHGHRNSPFNSDYVWDMGYYTGIAAACEAFMERHPGVFDSVKATSNESQKEKPSHRMHALAYHYKIKAKEASWPQSAEERKQGTGKQNRLIAFNSLNEKSSTYKEPTLKELYGAKQLLEKDVAPNALKAITNDIENYSENS